MADVFGQAIVPPSTPTLRERIEKLWASASCKSEFRICTELETFHAATVLLVVLSFQPSTAYANCAADNPVGGTTTCSGDPATFPNGGASAQGGNTTLNVNGLTANIVPSGGTAGAIVSVTPGQASGGTSLPIHGTNGDGGSASPDVTVNLTGAGSGFQVNTNNAAGIVAQSFGQAGGGGGDGFAALAVAFGGKGGSGGAGGNATVITTGAGTVLTSGVNQHGILALSVGGAGGNGGDGDSFLGAFGGGGDGGGGGAPKAATVNNVLNLTTTADGAAGIWAQSVGASGGNGGFAGGLNIGSQAGDGAAASGGGTVTVTGTGAISTSSNKAFGIFAQSVGGFAGSGGGSLLNGLSFGGDSSSAGAGGLVSVTTSGGSIHTHGVGSSAIFAQSVGGGGGAGGSGVNLIGFGGTGSTGGSGGSVFVSNHATLTVDGNQSAGIFAQAIGGGGGTGGDAVGLVGVGGNGGGASDGGTVEVHNFGGMTLTGSGSYSNASSATIAAGIFAQSIGGGGGDGGLGAGALGIGGRGGAAGNGKSVIVDNNADIKQNCAVGSCVAADAIFAQSIGGGGGNGGGSVGLVFAIGGNGGGGGTGGDVTVGSNSANLVSHGDFSRGILAQSIGGGGGNGGFSAGLIALGGDGVGGGIGGIVKVTASGSIHTFGANSEGILAQSIGGGGGSGGGAGGLASLGGKGGSGVNGNAVTVINSATIITEKDFSTGITAQSIGGGGGNGGFGTAALFTIGGSGGSGGSVGGIVTVTNNGSITTHGNDSIGILAQSIGGGGGNGAGAVSAGIFVGNGIGGSGGAGGDAGNVCVNANATCNGMDVIAPATIMSTGNRSSGISAQSIGGGGGNGGYAVAVSVGVFGSASFALGGKGGTAGKAGDVFVGANGTIQTSGASSNGIIAQSIGGGVAMAALRFQRRVERPMLRLAWHSAAMVATATTAPPSLYRARQTSRRRMTCLTAFSHNRLAAAAATVASRFPRQLLWASVSHLIKAAAAPMAPMARRSPLPASATSRQDYNLAR